MHYIRALSQQMNIYCKQQLQEFIQMVEKVDLSDCC